MILPILLIFITFTGYLHNAMATPTDNPKPLPASMTLVNDAIEQRESGKIKQSIILLEHGLELTPDNPRLKVELALSYFLENNYAKARMLAEEVLDVENIPEVVRTNISDFVAQIDAVEKNIKQDKNIVRHKGRVNYGYDSNANVAPEDTQIDIGQLPSTSVERSDRFIGWLYDYSNFKYAQPVIGNNKPSQLYYYHGFSFYGKKYDSVNTSDILYANGRTGLNYNITDNWFAKAKANIAYIRLNDASLVNYFQLDGEVGYRIGSSKISMILADNYRDYFSDTLLKFEGHHIRQSLAYMYNKMSAFDIRIQVSNHDANLNEESYSYDGSDVFLSTNVYLSERIMLGISGEYNKNKYGDVQQYYTDNRQDEITKLQLNVRFLDLYDSFDAELSYSTIERRSNHDINEYNRAIVTISIQYNFKN